MTAHPGYAFTCDSPDGCHAHVMGAGPLDLARANISEALGWVMSPDGDLCPDHADQQPVPPAPPGGTWKSPL